MVVGSSLFLLYSFSLTLTDCLCFSTFSGGALKGVGEGDLLEVEALGGGGGDGVDLHLEAGVDFLSK